MFEFQIDVTETHTEFQNYFDSAPILLALLKTYHREMTLIKDKYGIKCFRNGLIVL